MPSHIERAPRLTTSPKLSSVARGETQRTERAEPRERGAVPPEFEALSRHSRALTPSGEHVATSADPGALWGAGGAEEPESPELAEFKKMDPETQRAHLEALRGQRDVLTGQISERCARLDEKWKKLPPAKRREILRYYHRHSRRLDGATRRELNAALGDAELAQRRIDRLQERIKRLGPDKRGPNAALRKEMSAELRKLRAEHSAAVKEATAVVDEKGLKVDRLAVTEQQIDPAAPKGDKSLLSMVADWFGLSKLINSFLRVLRVEHGEEQKKAEEKRRQDEAQEAQRQERELLRRLQDELKAVRSQAARRAEADKAERVQKPRAG